MPISSSYQFQPIGFIESPCKEKFALPRQANLVPELTATIAMLPEYSRTEAFAQLDGFSHICVFSVFHLAIREAWQPTVRPPRLGGNTRVGVFASRAPYRPNPLAFSVVELLGVDIQPTAIRLRIAGCDLADGTPVLDIKPYLPYADAFPQARAGYTTEFKSRILSVTFSPDAQQACQRLGLVSTEVMQSLITRLVSQDPRPAYQEDSPDRQYAFRLYDFDVVFHVVGENAVIDSLRPRT